MTVDLIAPSGKYRVVGVDTFDGTNWVFGDYETEEAATAVAEKQGRAMLKTHVYSDTGEHLADFGTY